MCLAGAAPGKDVSWGASPTTVDVWSGGCVVAALYGGRHLFCVRHRHVGDKEECLEIFRQHVSLLGDPLRAWPGLNKLRWWPAAKLNIQPAAAPVTLDLPRKLPQDIEKLVLEET